MVNHENISTHKTVEELITAVTVRCKVSSIPTLQMENTSGLVIGMTRRSADTINRHEISRLSKAILSTRTIVLQPD